MGQETRCTVRYGEAVSEGRVQLESEGIRFRGDFRLTIPFADVRSIEADGGVLRLAFPDGVADFEIGPLAGAWAEKIRNPRRLIDKLDIKPGSRVAVLGVAQAANAEFWAQLRERTDFVLDHDLAPGLDSIILGVEQQRDLEQIDGLERYIQRNGAIWIVAPRNQPHLTELDVITTGRAAHLHDVKVAKFSATHTAHKFVIPRERR